MEKVELEPVDEQLQNRLKEVQLECKTLRDSLKPLQDIDVNALIFKLKRLEKEALIAERDDRPLKEQYKLVNMIIETEKLIEDEKAYIENWKKYYKLLALQDELSILVEPLPVDFDIYVTEETAAKRKKMADKKARLEKENNSITFN